jgi:hypothetical protein
MLSGGDQKERSKYVLLPEQTPLGPWIASLLGSHTLLCRPQTCGSPAPMSKFLTRFFEPRHPLWWGVFVGVVQSREARATEGTLSSSCLRRGLQPLQAGRFSPLCVAATPPLSQKGADGRLHGRWLMVGLGGLRRPP